MGFIQLCWLFSEFIAQRLFNASVHPFACWVAVLEDDV